VSLPPDADDGGLPEEHQEPVKVSILEGTTVQPTKPTLGAEPGKAMRAVLQGPEGAVLLDDTHLERHVLFLGGIGTGKTNAMNHLVRALRDRAEPDDVFVIFDTKGDFLQAFYRPGDAVISSDPDSAPGGVVWNLFSDLLDDDPAERGDQIFEIASTVFDKDLSSAGQNLYFAAAARDIFAGVVTAMSRDDQHRSNDDLRKQLDGSLPELWKLLTAHQDLAGTARYLQGTGGGSKAIRAFLQQTVSNSFTGAFRRDGDFSVRDFVRRKGGRALFIEYDIAIGSRLLPVYRVLIDMAIKEALGLGRRGAPGSVFLLLDEFALLPQLSHISDGINFGRSLGLKFIVGSQNVDQVLHAYGPEIGRTILSGFGTVFAFRLMDDASRSLVRQRFGANRKQITTYAAVRAQGVRQEVVIGNVIEDWVLSGLKRGRCVVLLPEGPPYFFTFSKYTTTSGSNDQPMT
jgi:Type IV secretion-system coupling protein DNA-binding domain